MLRSRVARVLALAVAVACFAFPVPAAHAAPAGEPGAAGGGDHYFPLEGNGG